MLRIKSLSGFVGTFLMFLSLFYLYGAIKNQLLELNLKLLYSNWPVYIFSVFAYLFLSMFITLAWHRLIFTLNARCGFKLCFIIYGLSQIGKYIPGNVLQFFGRQILGRRAGINNAVLAGSMLLEIALAIIAGSILSLFALLSLKLTDIQYFKHINYLALLVAAIVLVLAIYILVRIMGKKIFGIANNENINVNQFFINILFSICIYLIVFFLAGLLLWYLFESLYQNHNLPYYIFVGSYSLAWIIGFITPGAPGGLGIREVVLVKTLAIFASESQILYLALIFRLITTFGDLLFFAIAFFLSQQLGNLTTYKKRGLW